MSANAGATWEPYLATHPGYVLSEELEARGWSCGDLASQIGSSEQSVRQVLRGRAKVTKPFADKLETALGVSAAFWLRMQSSYEKTIERLGSDPTMEGDIALLDQLPLKDLHRQGWAQEVATDVERVIDLRILYGVSRLVDVPTGSIEAAFRVTPGSKVDPWALAAWVQQGEWQSIERKFLRPDDEGVCARFDPEILQATLPTLRRLTLARPFWSELRTLTGQAGVHLEFVPHIAKSGANGVTRWLDDGRPLIQVSILRKRADIFWFTLCHELGHVLPGDRSKVYIDLADGSDAADEHEAAADAFARDTLIPPADLDAFIHTQCFSARSVQQFATNIGVHPGIVVGRLQDDGLIGLDRLNSLTVSYDESDFAD